MVEGYVGEAGEQGIELGARSAVAIDAVVALLETEGGREREGEFLGKELSEVAAQNVHALVVQASTHLGLFLDVYHAALAGKGVDGDARRAPKRVVTHAVDRQPIDLPDFKPVGGNEIGAFLDELVDLLLVLVGAVTLLF